MKERKIPFFGARKFAAELVAELEVAIEQRDRAHSVLKKIGGLTVLELNEHKKKLEGKIAEDQARSNAINQQLAVLARQVVETEDSIILQEAGVYSYSHPLSDAVAYQSRLLNTQEQIKSMNRKDGGAVLATTSWTVNGSASEGRTMVRDFSKLLLRAFNAEADNLVRGMKPYKLQSAIDRLTKVSDTITKLGRTMSISIAPAYFGMRIQELKLTADFLQKQAEEKELERVDVGYGKHLRVDHSKDEFVRGHSHINGIEGFWGFAKSRLTRFRGMNKQSFYLHLKECEFRFNHRKENIYPIVLKLCRDKPLN